MLTASSLPTEGRGSPRRRSSPYRHRKRHEVVPEGLASSAACAGSEYLNFVGRMYGLDLRHRRATLPELLDFVQLSDRPKSLRFTTTLHGMQKKSAVATAVIHGRQILFLDEPFEGVDAIAYRRSKGRAATHHSLGATVFPASHVSRNRRAPSQCT